MILEAVLEPFLKQSPLTVMARLAVGRALDSGPLDALFNRAAESQYTRELLFSTTVDLLAQVVCGSARHVSAAYARMADRVPVSLSSVYEKLQGVENNVCSTMVRFTSGRCQEVLAELAAARPGLLPGYRLRVVDGNCLAATHKKLKALRGQTGGALPGKTLCVYDPALDQIVEVICCEDGHAQERSRLDQLAPLVKAGDLWLADRNFCTVDWLAAVAQSRGYFLVRRHGNTTVEAEGEWSAEVETETGWVRECPAHVCRGGGREFGVRLVRVRLKSPTRDGERVLELLTNVPPEVRAAAVADLYRTRWKIETAFARLTMELNCELNTLGYPKAALFGFCVAVVAYNAQALVQAALRSAHGGEKVDAEFSAYRMSEEVGAVSAGMAIAVPEEAWGRLVRLPLAEFARLLREVATRVDLRRYRKQKWKPRVRTKKAGGTRGKHVATSQLLDAAKQTQDQTVKGSP